MLGTKVSRARDTMVALYCLCRVRFWYVRGSGHVAARTARAMRRLPATQDELDARHMEAWHVARAVWRAKRWLPFHSTCLQTALATQMVLDSRRVNSVVRVGVNALEADAHAWVEVGDFVLDDQRIAGRFMPFDLAQPAAGTVDA